MVGESSYLNLLRTIYKSISVKAKHDLQSKFWIFIYCTSQLSSSVFSCFGIKLATDDFSHLSYKNKVLLRLLFRQNPKVNLKGKKILILSFILENLWNQLSRFFSLFSAREIRICPFALHL